MKNKVVDGRRLNWSPAVWRNSYLKPRFFVIDGRFSVLLLVALLHVSWFTVEAAAGAAIVLGVIELWFGVTPEIALRKARSTIAGTVRPATRHVKNRLAIDYGYIEWLAVRDGVEESDSF